MGARYSRPDPVVQTFTEGGDNDRIWYAVASRQDRRRNRKDAFAAVPDLDGSTSFFGVYDGHGGDEVALLCATQFHTELHKDPYYRDNLVFAMERTFFSMDAMLQESADWKKLLHPRETHGLMQCLPLKACISGYSWPFAKRKPNQEYEPPQVSGSTACVAAIRGHQIIIGNVGRSRCIISRNGQAIELTTDHEPSNLIERERIETAGRKVINVQAPGETEEFFQQHGAVGTLRIDGILAHSRAIGDFKYKLTPDFPPENQAVTCDPEIRTVDITNDIDFLAIVSDGICPYLSSQTVVGHIRKGLYSRTINLPRICVGLCDHCVASGDNATVILVQFKNAPPAPAPPGNGGNNNITAQAQAPPAPAPPGNGGNNAAQAQLPPAPAPPGNGGGNDNAQAQAPAPAHEGDEPEALPLLHGEITEA